MFSLLVRKHAKDEISLPNRNITILDYKKTPMKALCFGGCK